MAVVSVRYARFVVRDSIFNVVTELVLRGDRRKLGLSKYSNSQDKGMNRDAVSKR